MSVLATSYGRLEFHFTNKINQNIKRETSLIKD